MSNSLRADFQRLFQRWRPRRVGSRAGNGRRGEIEAGVHVEVKSFHAVLVSHPRAVTDLIQQARSWGRRVDLRHDCLYRGRLRRTDDQDREFHPQPA